MRRETCNLTLLFIFNPQSLERGQNLQLAFIFNQGRERAEGFTFNLQSLERGQKDIEKRDLVFLLFLIFKGRESAEGY